MRHTKKTALIALAFTTSLAMTACTNNNSNSGVEVVTDVTDESTVVTETDSTSVTETTTSGDDTNGDVTKPSNDLNIIVTKYGMPRAYR